MVPLLRKHRWKVSKPGYMITGSAVPLPGAHLYSCHEKNSLAANLETLPLTPEDELHMSDL